MERLDNHLITIREVMAMTNIKSRTTVYALVKRKVLPSPYYLSPSVPRWQEAEVVACLANLPRV